MNLKITLTMLLVIVCLDTSAQDLVSMWNNFKKIKDAKILSYSGGFNSSFAFYGIHGAEPRKAPFSYALNANINFSVLGKVSIPLSINYTDRGVKYSAANPYIIIKNQIKDILSKTGFSPKYKAITLHIGERSLNFSQNTYSGVRFYGFGIEVKPKNSFVSIAAFRGRLSKKIEPQLDSLGIRTILPTYRRIGTGVKLNIGQKKQRFNLIMFHAQDDLNSFDSLSPEYNVLPQENLVLGINANNRIGRYLQTKIEYVVSAYTADIRTPARQSETTFSYFNNLGSLFTPLLSTRYDRAFSSAINYKRTEWSLGGSYKRIDPTFISLGSLSTKRDLEASTLNGTLNLFKNRIMLSAKGGKERNNLNQNLSLSMKRFIFSGNMVYNMLKNLILTANYTNFNHSTTPSLINLADTLKLMQVNASKTFNTVFMFGKENYKQAFIFNAALQNTLDIKESSEVVENSQSLVANYNLSYSLTSKKANLATSLSFSYTLVAAAKTNNVSIGPSFVVNKKFLNKKLAITFTSAYLNTTNNIGNSSNIQNFKLGFKYIPTKKHAIQFENAIINKINETNPEKSFTEYQGKLSYIYRF